MGKPIRITVDKNRRRNSIIEPISEGNNFPFSIINKGITYTNVDCIKIPSKKLIHNNKGPSQTLKSINSSLECPYVKYLIRAICISFVRP
jgi:hypothetical protein